MWAKQLGAFPAGRKSNPKLETLAQLTGHEHFSVTETNDLAIMDPLDRMNVLIGDLSAADYGNAKHCVLLILETLLNVFWDWPRNAAMASCMLTRGVQPNDL
jgi:hypothetical protein